MTKIEPCKVCGSTEAKLIDGYYYCVECGTQDVNVRQTVVEDIHFLADGNFTFRVKKKIHSAPEEHDNLSEEWYKWHAYNIILVSLADEMIAIGAKPTFKKKLLWLWTEYMKKFQNKKELGLNTEVQENENICEDKEGTDNEEEYVLHYAEFFKRRRPPRNEVRIDLAIIKRGLFFSLIYVALQLDGNNIHVTDLFRFMKQGKFSILNCEKFVPKEIKLDKIPRFGKFCLSKICPEYVEKNIMSVYKFFQILPPVPDFKVLVHRYAKELCLPEDFKNLVFSLMHFLPCDHLKLDYKIMKQLRHIPFYECYVMSYFLIAFKMLFGLDDDYELRLCDAVNKINDENCYLKSYNLGSDSEPTDRLFSFQEWCHFIQLRKTVLCKNYLFMAEHYQMPIDHYVYMEQCHERKARKPTLCDEITMTLLNRIPQEAVVAVIPISEFKASLTPLFSASEVILQYFNDPDLKLLFSEDFTQYSLKYATEKLYLIDSEEESSRNVVVGVSSTNKKINKNIIGSLAEKKFDCELVLVRNCDNKNWLTTNQPSVNHVEKLESDKESDHCYDSNVENASTVEISINDTTGAVDSTDTPVEEDKIETTTDSSRAENLSALDNSSVAEIRNSANVTDSTEVNLNQIKVEADGNDSKSVSAVKIGSQNDSETTVQNMKRELEKIEEEDYDKNIFDDDFADLVEVKPEPVVDQEQFNCESHDNIDSHQHDARSETSVDDSERFFNETTFDREKTIRELVLATCKKYKIGIPKEYRPNEPKKRKSQLTQDGAGESRPKKQKLDDGTPKIKIAKRGQVKDEINNLLDSYFENLKHDVLFQVSEHVKSVVNNVSRTHEENNSTWRIHDEVADYGNSQREPNVTDTFEHPLGLNTEDNHHISHENEIDGSTIEQSSIQLVEDETDNQAEGDPRLDENEYDPKQLYVRVEGEPEIEDVFDVADDPEIAAILDKKLQEIEKGEQPSISTRQRREIDYESDDDVPLSFLRKEKLSSQQREIDESDDDVPLSFLRQKNISLLRKSNHRELPPLLSNHSHLGEFNYWARHYRTTKLRKTYECHEQFYMEIDKHFPRNFTFVLRECADVIGCTPFRLYKVLMDLERRLLCYYSLN